MPDHSDFDRILVINLANIGDVVVSSPLFRALGETYPAAEIDIVTTPRTAPIAKFIPYVHQVIPYDKFGAERGFFNFIAKGRNLRQSRYQLAVTCNQSQRSAALTYLSGAKTRIGFRGRGGGVFLTDTVDTAVQGHMAEFLLGLLTPLNVRPANSSLELKIDGIGSIPQPPQNKPEIVLCPFSRGPDKDWTAEGCAGVIEELSLDYQVYLIGGPQEKAQLEAINEQAGHRAIVLAGTHSLEEIARLIKRAALTISVDTGPAHIAEALGANLIVLFGYNNSVTWGPRKATSRVVSAHIGCKTCENKGCSQQYRCMKEIRAEHVIAAAKNIMKTSISTQ